MSELFVTRAELQVEPSPWGPHEWLSRPGLTDAKELLLVRVLMPPGRAHQFHRHPAMEEIIYVVSGTYNAGKDMLVFLAILSPAVFDGPALVDVHTDEPWASLKKPMVFTE